MTIREFCERYRSGDDLPSLYDVLWVHFAARPDDVPTTAVWEFLKGLPQ